MKKQLFTIISLILDNFIVTSKAFKTESVESEKAARAYFAELSHNELFKGKLDDLTEDELRDNYYRGGIDRTVNAPGGNSHVVTISRTITELAG